jgi:hypothetical protein
MIEVEEGAFVIPLHWFLSGKLKESQIFDDLVLWDVEGISIVGIASPRVLGAPTFSYLLLLLVGWLTLSTPLLVRLELSHPRAKSLQEVKEFVDQILSRSKLESGLLARLRRQIRHAKSVANMADAVAQARE